MNEPTEAQRKASAELHKLMAAETMKKVKDGIVKHVLDNDDRREKVDRWIAANSADIDRLEAIRQLVDLGLKAKAK
jgi:hypothetical protein